jgi:hypothetical protein
LSNDPPALLDSCPVTVWKTRVLSPSLAYRTTPKAEGGSVSSGRPVNNQPENNRRIVL